MTGIFPPHHDPSGEWCLDRGLRQLPAKRAGREPFVSCLSINVTLRGINTGARNHGMPPPPQSSGQPWSAVESLSDDTALDSSADAGPTRALTDRSFKAAWHCRFWPVMTSMVFALPAALNGSANHFNKSQPAFDSNPYRHWNSFR